MGKCLGVAARLTGWRASAIIGGLLLLAAPVLGQVCRFSVAGLNQARRVIGPVHAECAGDFALHSPPFGNWGVTSNYGSKRNGHQFDGWCHDTVVCDSFGACRTNCKDGWYEWNSCTDAAPFAPPNCSLYNAAGCTEQVSTTGANVLGTQTIDLPVRCPLDSNGDGSFDSGGCADVTTYTHTPNFMSIYELDPGAPDELIQTLYFPVTPVPLSCSVYNCPPAVSQYVAPNGYDSPASPPKIYAELATIVNSGTFIDSSGACRAAVTPLASVSAASLTGPALAPASLASAFGEGLAGGTARAESTPLPLTLGGASLLLTDSAGTAHQAPLYFASPGQINFLVPEAAAAGTARVAVKNGDGYVASGTVQIERVAPGLFTANSDGRGVAAAVAVRVAPGGRQTSQLVFECGTAPGGCVSVPIDLGGPSDEVVLLLFGTGLRKATSVGASIGGMAAEVLYAGPQCTYDGLDQINVRLPRSLAGRGEVQVLLTADSRAANPALIRIR